MAMSGSRVLALLGVGLFSGALGAFVVMNTLAQRHQVPRGSMAMMQYHMQQARNTARSTTCDGAAAQRHLQRMRALGEDSSAIFGAIGYVDASFERRRDGFLAEVDKGIAGGSDCAAIGSALKQIADACEACHHDTR